MNNKNHQSCGMDISQRELDEVELNARMSRIGRKLIVMSGKGGVGKSTVAANLAVALAATGKTVGLLDVDLHGPSIPTLVGLEHVTLESDAAGHIIPFDVSDHLKVVSIGMLLDSPDDAVIWRGPMKYGVIQKFLKDVAWGTLDYLVIDSPPGTGDEPLAVAQLVGEDASAVIVTTPQDVAVNDVRRSVSFCRTLDLHVLGILENMSGMTCPHCDVAIDPFKIGGGERLAHDAGIPFLGRIPLDPRITRSGDEGVPLADTLGDAISMKLLGSILSSLGTTPLPRSDLSTTSTLQESPMRIALPVSNGVLCMHFGHCEQFALLDVDSKTADVKAISYLTPPPHEPGVLPVWLAEHGTQVVIAGGMGRRAIDMFTDTGIELVVGAKAADPEELAIAYLAGRIETGDNVCDH